MPVHVGGLMLDVAAVSALAARHGLWIVEDAAHAFPAAYRSGPDAPWRRSGEDTAAVTCFSFYANKTITTGEGGMAVTADAALAERMRQMSLHGLSHDAWNRFSKGGSWDYRIVAPGYKYNLTDLAAALGLGQLERAEAFRSRREAIARHYSAALAAVEAVELPPWPVDRIHAWHLFILRLRLDMLPMDRGAVVERLRERGVSVSVHWRPLHLHPYYERTFGWEPGHFPAASREWLRNVSLPLFPAMREEEWQYVVSVIRELCSR